MYILWLQLTEHHIFSNETIQDLKKVSWIENIDNFNVSEDIESQIAYEVYNIYLILCNIKGSVPLKRINIENSNCMS